MDEEPIASPKQLPGKAQSDPTVGGSEAAETARADIGWLRHRPQMQHRLGLAFSWNRIWEPTESPAFCSWKKPFSKLALTCAAQAGGTARGGVVFGHLPGMGPSRRKSCEMLLLEIRITDSPPRQEFLTLIGLGSKVHCFFFSHKRHFSLCDLSSSVLESELYWGL